MRGAEGGIVWVTAAAGELPEDDAWLGPWERAVLASLRAGPRRESWLLGRYAAKRLLPPDVEILPGPGGAPRAFRGHVPVAGCVSISHRDGVGLCAAAPAAVGCDLERVEPRSPAFVGDFFTPAEQALVARAAEPAVVANLVWSAKESALKALGVGLRRDTRGLDVAIDGPALVVRDLELGGAWRGFWRREGELLATFVGG